MGEAGRFPELAGRMIFARVDRALSVAVARAAEPGGLRFTERQLYYEMCRVLRPVHRAPRRPRFTVAPALSYRDFRAALSRRGTVPGLLTEAELAPRAGFPGEHTAEPDLFDYGLPRLLICQRQQIAAMLCANGIPLESACPVLGPEELPLDPRVETMLSRVTGTIYLLHDATPAGLAWCAGTTPGPGVRMTVLGLRPSQAGAMHLVHGRAPGPLGRGKFVEVAAMHPAALLRLVHRQVRGIRGVPDERAQWTELRRARGLGFLSWPRG